MTGPRQSHSGAEAGSSGPFPGEPDAMESPQRQRRLQALARGMDLYLDLEDLAEEWIERVCGPDLSRDEAILALLAGLKGGLERHEQNP